MSHKYYSIFHFSRYSLYKEKNNHIFFSFNHYLKDVVLVEIECSLWLMSSGEI